MATTEIVPDSEHRGLVGALPAAARPYALLARFDRPIGWWLLYWPCAWGTLLFGELGKDWPLLLWFLLGAIAMRGAGCVYNDIVDRDLDLQVERTRLRPVASGAVSVRAAWIWLVVLCLIGLIVLLQLRWEAQIVALASLVPVAIYPFMKRFTWWPQVGLGIVFTWGALVSAAAVTGELGSAAPWLFAGSICWGIGYDTIYALQDKEDDALIGARSSALRLGENVRAGVTLFYSLALAGWGLAFWMVRPQPVVFMALLPAALHLSWQIAALKPGDGADALAKFRANRFTGLLVALACLVVGQSA